MSRYDHLMKLYDQVVVEEDAEKATHKREGVLVACEVIKNALNRELAGLKDFTAHSEPRTP